MTSHSGAAHDEYICNIIITQCSSHVRHAHEGDGTTLDLGDGKSDRTVTGALLMEQSLPHVPGMAVD